jgi:hypothetical protein
LIEENDIDEIYDRGSALDRRLVRQSMQTISTDGPFAEVTFRDPYQRKSSDLSGKEVIRLYDAISFAQWQFGPSAIFNTHITILWQTYGIKDHEHASALLGLYLNEARKWARVGQNPKPRRQRPRTGNHFVFRYVYANECSGQQGFHSHVLTALPQPAVAAFKAWTRAILPKLTGQAGDQSSVVFRVRFANEQVMIDRCWHWFRYVAKQCDETKLRDNNNDLSKGKGYTVLLRDGLKLWSHQNLQPVHCRQLSKPSRDINAGTQRRAPAFPGLLWRRLDRLYDGAEVESWRQTAGAARGAPPPGPSGGHRKRPE